MAVVKKANIVPLVAVIVIIFSVTVHAFAEGNDHSSLSKRQTDGKSENAGNENKKKVDEAPATEKGGEKSSNETEKKTEGDKKANTDKPPEKQTAKSDTKVTDKPSDKPSDMKTDKLEIKLPIRPPPAITKKLEIPEKSDKADKGNKQE